MLVGQFNFDKQKVMFRLKSADNRKVCGSACGRGGALITHRFKINRKGLTPLNLKGRKTT
jgi:hypothetical protein